MNEFDKLKDDFHNIEIPKDLDRMTKKTIQKARMHRRLTSVLKYTASSAAVLLLGITVISNTNQALANTMKDIPVLGNVVQIVSFTEFKEEQPDKSIDVKTPHLEGTDPAINAEIAKTSQEIINRYLQKDTTHLALSSSYEVKCDNDQYLSFVIEYFEAAGSSSTSYKCYTIDKKTNQALGLKDFFPNTPDYREKITAEVKKQLDQRGVLYFEEEFTIIKPDQNFFLDEEGRISICFDEYEIAPGSEGPLIVELPADFQ